MCSIIEDHEDDDRINGGGWLGSLLGNNFRREIDTTSSLIFMMYVTDPATYGRMYKHAQLGNGIPKT
jgi:hypothetical protein